MKRLQCSQCDYFQGKNYSGLTRHQNTCKGFSTKRRYTPRSLDPNNDQTGFVDARYETAQSQQSFEASDSALNTDWPAEFYTAHYDAEGLPPGRSRCNKDDNEFVSTQRQI